MTDTNDQLPSKLADILRRLSCIPGLRNAAEQTTDALKLLAELGCKDETLFKLAPIIFVALIGEGDNNRAGTY
ncbi:MAG: hypothetical protein MPL62_18490 [Alphaproteobacteria bacterium]|nr:hypothetical protein [Alphaproteobacteria bacterium]